MTLEVSSAVYEKLKNEMQTRPSLKTQRDDVIPLRSDFLHSQNSPVIALVAYLVFGFRFSTVEKV